jgi:hypothetical protein
LHVLFMHAPGLDLASTTMQAVVTLWVATAALVDMRVACTAAEVGVPR